MAFLGGTDTGPDGAVSVDAWLVMIPRLSHEQSPGWLGYIGDELLPSNIGIIINHYKDPY